MAANAASKLRVRLKKSKAFEITADTGIELLSMELPTGVTEFSVLLRRLIIVERSSFVR
jgi:hypothetical protein